MQPRSATSDGVVEDGGRRAASRLALALVIVLLAGCGGSGEPATCSPAGTELRIAVTGSATHRFDTDCLAAPADQPFTIAFTNDDPSSHGNHNVAIVDGTDELFVGDIIRGGASTVYEVDPLAAGTYSFVCTNHSNMRGAFIVSAT